MKVKDHLRLRAALTGSAAVVGLLGVVIFTNGNLDVSGVIFYLALLAVPFGAYMLLIRSRPASVTCGVTLIGMVIVVQLMVTSFWEGGSSTAPVGYLWIPLTGITIVALTAMWERS